MNFVRWEHRDKEIEDRPPYSRCDSIDLALDLLSNIENPFIIEFGMTRLENNWNGDGNSTIIFSWFVSKHNGKLISVDINKEYLLTTTKILYDFELFEYLNKNIFLKCSDAIEYIENNDYEKVDLIYYDAWDYTLPEEKPISEIKHLEAYEKSKKWMKSGTLILIDDCFIKPDGSVDGKGKLMIPKLFEEDFECLHKGYQFLFRKR